MSMKLLEPNSLFESQKRKLTRKDARHLLRRTWFGFSESQTQSFVGVDSDEAVELLLNEKPTDSFLADMEQIGRLILASRQPRSLAAWWLYRMAHTDADQFREKLTLFWHGHFATSAAKVNHVGLVLNQNQMLREKSLGRFEEMVQAISRDPAMLIYLDSTENRKTHPNENYARELLELFCLGLGNYSEKDIQEIARCFTGWEVRQRKFRFNKYQHDVGEKKFLGAKGNFDGTDAVQIVLKQKAASRFIAKKLLRYYVSDEFDWTDARIDPLAILIEENDFQIESALRTILNSRVFYSDEAIGKKVRSPVELAIGFIRTTGAATNFYELANRLEQLGQLPFYPPNVKGWDGGRRWINASSIIGRSNMIHQIVHSNDTKWKEENLAIWLRNGSGAKEHEKKVRWLVDQLIAVEISNDTMIDLLKATENLNLDRSDDVAELICVISTLPEFHLN